MIVSDFGDSYRIYRACELVIGLRHGWHILSKLTMRVDPPPPLPAFSQGFVIFLWRYNWTSDNELGWRGVDINCFDDSQQFFKKKYALLSLGLVVKNVCTFPAIFVSTEKQTPPYFFAYCLYGLARLA